MSRILSRLALVFLFFSAVAVHAEDRAHIISLSSGKIDVRQADKAIPEHLKSFAGEPGSRIMLVKFPGPVSAEQLLQLEQQVERVYTYLPHDTFLVKLAADKAALRAESLAASWVGIYHPAYKISPSVAAMAAGATEKKERRRSLMLHVYPDADLGQLSAEIARRGFGKVVGQSARERFSRLRLLLAPGQIAKIRQGLAQLPDIFWLDIEPRRTLLNDTTVWVAQSGTGGGQATPVYDAGIVGQGQIVGVLDTGIDADMCYFRDTALGLPPQNPCNGGTLVDNNQRKVIGVDFLWANECSGGISNTEWDTQDHGTHVAGTIAGDDFANPLSHDAGDGIAPGAKLVVQDCGFLTDDCADCPGIGSCPVVDLNPVFQQAYDQGARIHTNSWGDDENNPVQGLYSAGSEDADEVMWNNKDFLLVFAAGNSGPGTTTVGSPSTAKSVVSVGATLRGTSANSMASFSSCGPTDDGRIKPDITMPGSGIISANADNNLTTNNCNTKSLSGTSMAAPGAAGSLALIRQYFTDGFYPSGSANAGDAFTPSGILLKATLMNSGRNMTGTTAIPSNCQGWGRVLLDDALYFGGDSRQLFVEDDATGFAGGSSGESRDFGFTVGSTSESFKVTLAWADFPSTPAANPHINNDLDLVVTGPGGTTTWLGNVFSGGSSITGGSADRLNSVEQVLIATPAAGDYTVSVRSFTVPNGPQPFALVVSGDINNCSPAPAANAGADRTICAGDSTTLGAATQAGNSYSWSPGGATTSQITVSPSVTTTYTVTATTSCGSAQDAVTVTVDSGAGGGLNEDFEGGLGSWTSGGLWHLTTNSSCATPGYSSATNAVYYGQDAGCTYNTGGVTTGSLTSPMITGINATSTLTFDYYRVVESFNGDFDRTQVNILSGGGSTNVFSLNATNASTAAWVSSGAIDLSAFAGQSIQVEFVFNTVDGTANGFTGWLIDDVVVTADSACTPPTNTAPSVTISAPADGSSSTVGGSVSFSGSATDPEDGSLTASLSWTSSLDGAIGSGGSFSITTLSAGSHTITASVTDSGGLAGSDAINITVNGIGGGCTDCIDWNTTGTVSYSNQDTSANFTVEDGGDTLLLADNTWRRTTQSFTITTNTVLELEFSSAVQGEIQGIGFDEDDTLTNDVRIFQLHGTQNWGSANHDFDNYAGGGTFTTYTIPVGQYYTGTMFLVLVNDNDAGSGNDSRFRNVRVYENTPPPGTCAADVDFESGAPGWTNSGTCTTGSFVVGTPTEVIAGGVTTQLAGDHTTGTGNAYFSAVNTSAGSNDVDGGTCIVESPTYTVAEASNVSLWYFHGQRDAGDDAGDFFRLEISTDGGTNYTTLASSGDVTVNAAWTQATTTVAAGTSVKFRLQVADGGGGGDLIEAGLDDVSVCPQ